MKKYLKNKNGFTFIETLIYITIIGLVIGGFMVFTLYIIRSHSKTYVVQEVQANSRMALGLISQKIRLAEDVVVPIEGNSGSFLELNMPNPSPNLIFSLTNGILNITEGIASSIPITSNEVNVSNLIFTNLAEEGERDNIRIEIILEYKGSGSREYDYSQSLQTAVSIRR